MTLSSGLDKFDEAVMVGTFQVCGDCAAVLLERGGSRVTERNVIGLGVQCETHGGHGPQATSVIGIVWEEANRRFSEFEQVAPVPGPAVGYPRELGPVTMIARDLLVAWSSGEKSRDVDELTIRRSVDVARQLLRETGGA